MLDFPKKLAKTTETFAPPPLEEDALTLPELWDFHLENSPNHPLFVYHDGIEKKTIYWKEAVHAVHRAAYLVNGAVENGGRPSTRPVIAVLAATETITYSCFAMGCLRAGYAIFALSPRNNPPAVAFLLEKVAATHLFISGEPALKGLSGAALANMSKSIPVHTMPVFETLFPASSGEFQLYPPQSYERKAAAVILHSSGSTSFPKPIFRTHDALVEPGRVPWFGDINLTGVVNSAHALPVFHGMGIINLGFVACSGMVLSVFKPSGSMMLPTPETVMAAAIADQTEIMVSVPTFVEAWSRSPEGLAFLKGLTGAIYAGGPLNKEVGDRLAEQGVQIHCVYATTETGPLCKYLRSSPGKDWEYFEFSPHVHPTLIPYEEGESFEIIVKRNPILKPMTINTQVDGVDAYATSDLVIPHPTIPGLYKIHGRSDDQIMLSTGEKTNPGPLETILCQDPKVHAAVIFGRERTSNGVIIAPEPEFACDPTDQVKLAKFRNDIWATVERMNAFAPTHSRLFKEMIIVESSSKPFQYTAKATVRRQFMIKEYEREINELYDTVEATTQNAVSAPEEWTNESAQDFVKNVVISVMNKAVDHDADLFSYGCDSLQATWIRHAITGAIKKSVNVHTARRIPNSVVYQHPTINDLSTYVLDLATSSGVSQDPEALIQKKITEMNAILKKYTANFPARPTATKPNSAIGDVVLLTGSTGGFGSGLLHNLLLSKDVRKVYALNRPSSSGQSLEERQKKALSWDIEDLLGKSETKEKLLLIEADTSKDNLGLSNELYNELLSSITHIIHNAWRVDFNLSLLSFDTSLRGVKNLIDLALKSNHPQPPRLLFISSVGVFNRPSTKGLFKEEALVNARTPVGTGYGEAKWIGEQIISTAAEKTDLQPIVVRLGQIAGNKDGYWNEREWLPSIVKSALSLKCLPDAKGSVTWMPSYDASRALTELRNANKPYLHLVHPRPTPWSTVLGYFAKAMSVPLVPFPQWLTSLQNSLTKVSVPEAELMLNNPALRLIEFFAAVDQDEDREPLGIVRMDPTNAVETSLTLKNLQPLTEAEVSAWLAAWKKAGFL